MDPTTLVTFLFKAPSQCRAIELIGSWDNFTHPYTMYHDRKRGQGLWTGCFKFHDIICDGDRADWSRPRQGGLKQGGTYWYYYRLDDDAEAIDRSQPITSSCPLMPGMTVNVLEVPTEVLDPPARCRSASAGPASTLQSLSSRQTLDPDDKFAALEPPPITKLQRHYASDLALHGRLETESFKRIAISPPPSGFISTYGRSQSMESLPRSGNSRLSRRKRIVRPLTRSSMHSSRSWYSMVEPSMHAGFSAYSLASAYHFDDRSVQSSHSMPDFPLPPSLQLRPANATRPETRRGEGATSTFEFGMSANTDSANVAPRSIFDVQIQGKAMYEEDNGDSWCPTFYHHLPHLLASDKLQMASTAAENQQEQSSNMPTLLFEPESSTSPQSENGYFDIWSPTFSAATMSPGGLNTPYRLLRTNTALTQADDLDDLAARLEHLDTSDAARSSDQASPTLVTNAEALRSESMFSHYSLPSQRASKDVTPVKTSTEALPLLSLPLSLGADHGMSMADAILGELGYLGGSIN